MNGHPPKDYEPEPPEEPEDWIRHWPEVAIAIGLGLIAAHFITTCTYP